MHLIYLLIFLHLMVEGFCKVEDHFGRRCMSIDYQIMAKSNYVLYAYPGDVAKVVCRVEQPERRSVLTIQHRDLHGEETHYRIINNLRREKELSVNLTAQDDDKAVECCYKTRGGEKSRCRSVTFALKGLSFDPPKTKCVIVEIPTMAKVKVVRPPATQSARCGVSLASTDVEIDDVLSATCAARHENSTLNWFQKQRRGKGFDYLPLEHNTTLFSPLKSHLNVNLDENFLNSIIECFVQYNTENKTESKTCGFLMMSQKDHETIESEQTTGFCGAREDRASSCLSVADDQFRDGVYHLRARSGDVVEMVCRVINGNPEYISSIYYSDLMRKDKTNFFSLDFPDARDNARVAHAIAVNLTRSHDNKQVSCCYDYGWVLPEQFCRKVQFVLKDNTADYPTKKCVQVYVPTAVQVQKVQEAGAQSGNCTVTFSSDRVALGDTLNVVCVSDHSESKLKWSIKKENEKYYRPLDEVLQKVFKSSQQTNCSSCDGHIKNESLKITTDLLGLYIQCSNDDGQPCGAFAMKIEDRFTMEAPTFASPKRTMEIIEISCGVAVVLLVLLSLTTCWFIKFLRRRKEKKNVSENTDIKIMSTSDNESHNCEEIDCNGTSLQEKPVYEEIDCDKDTSSQINTQMLGKHIIVQSQNKVKQMMDEYIVVEPQKRTQKMISDGYTLIPTEKKIIHQTQDTSRQQMQSKENMQEAKGLNKEPYYMDMTITK